MTPLNKDEALRRLRAASDALGTESGETGMIENALKTARRALLNILIVLERDPSDPD